MRGLNKKGQGMSTNTIILLVLGLIVLAALAYGFATGWSAFQSETGKTNVDEIAEQCKTSCSLDQKFGFCNTDVEIRIQEEDLEYKTSCGVLSTVPEFARMGIRSCSRIDCEVPCESIRINGEFGEKAANVGADYHDVSAYASDVSAGEFCVVLRA